MVHFRKPKESIISSVYKKNKSFEWNKKKSTVLKNDVYKNIR